jgi:hypothetical protein
MTDNRHTALHRHLRICREDAWGQCPAEPSWQSVPIFGDGYKTAPSAALFSPETQFGGWRRAVLLPELTHVRGALVCLAWPQVTALLLGMALDRTDDALGSYCLDAYTPAGPRRCLGVMAEGLELVASAKAATSHEASDGVELRLSLRGRTEEANSDLAEADFSYAAVSPVPFGFGGAALSIGGTPLASVGALRLRIDNHLDEGPSQAGALAFLVAGPRTVSLELTKADDDDALRDALRTGAPLAFDAVFTHPAGHTLTIGLPRLYTVTGEDRATPGAVAEATTRLEAAADITGADITWSLHLST